jgi:hypothetical protein
MYVHVDEEHSRFSHKFKTAVAKSRRQLGAHDSSAVALLGGGQSHWKGPRRVRGKRFSNEYKYSVTVTVTVSLSLVLSSLREVLRDRDRDAEGIG